MQSSKSQKAIYGKIALTREECPVCEQVALVVQGRFACCGAAWEKKPATEMKRMIAGYVARKPLNRTSKDLLLRLQHNKCFYCKVDLQDTWYMRADMDCPKQIRVEFDHVVPWVYKMDDDFSNFVAACNICNRIKRDRIFNDMESLVKYVLWRRDMMQIEIM